MIQLKSGPILAISEGVVYILFGYIGVNIGIAARKMEIRISQNQLLLFLIKFYSNIALNDSYKRYPICHHLPRKLSFWELSIKKLENSI